MEEKLTVSEIKSKATKILVSVFIAIIVLASGYLYAVLNWSFSKGDRIGYVQKFSEKGWVCKTWEGELQMLPVPGALPEKFLFTARDKSIVKKLNSSLGKRVALSYEQHKGIPTKSFGETEYFIKDVRDLE
jgi:hypothetical protein